MKSKKEVIKTNKRKMMKKVKSKKGFTLVELLATILILGIIMIIAIPAVSKYIMGSRESAYVTSINKYAEEARNEINGRIYTLKREDTIYYIPTKCLKIENKDESPYGTMLESYVAVTYKKGGEYTYYYVGRDDTGHGIGELTKVSEIDESTLSSDVGNVTTEAKFGKARVVVYSDNCDGTYSDGQNVGNPVCKIKTDGGLCECSEEAGNVCINYECQGNVRAELTDYEMVDVGILNYGIGTSETPDYNMKKYYELETGITTVVGYVKNRKGDEGICSANISLVEGNPEFTVRYGYYIYPGKENSTTSGITVSGTSHLTTNGNPTITLTGLSKYRDVERVVIYLNNTITRSTVASVTMGGTTKTAPVAVGTERIEFVVDKGTYSSLVIRLGDLSGETYDISKIELQSLDGSIYTERDVVVHVEDNSSGLRIVRYSFDDGEWVTSNKLTVTTNKNGTIKGRNSSEQIKSGTYSVTGIDRNIPTVTMVAKGAESGNVLESGIEIYEGVVYKFTSGNVGVSGATIYYCYDTNNTCNPNVEAISGSDITDYVDTEGSYYMRYRVVSGAGISSNIASFNITVRKEYTLTFDNNGGSGCTTTTAKASQAWGNLCTPTKGNYDFLGWYTEINGGIQVTASSIAENNLIVHARWGDLQNPTCTISITNNGSTDGITTTVTCNDSVGCASNNPTGDTGLKSSKTYTVADTSGNTATCRVTVTSQLQKQTQECNNTYGRSCTYCGSTTSCHTTSENTQECTASCDKCWYCKGNQDKYWTSWSNVSSCTANSTTHCRTIYNGTVN